MDSSKASTKTANKAESKEKHIAQDISQAWTWSNLYAHYNDQTIVTKNIMAVDGSI
jgi:hypothetical protein